ncbi:hypothetical protein B0H15DRAFT_953896 [Mycena belliarum]|uniref:Uncharacterized protein n=1 Tax=Mycena belliarum TaxID=1033014 RepID=A0AAD6TYL3_9AGAR|nr:hypothetical protein B0H15DRAFT_953896 [Mycena belliae]
MSSSAPPTNATTPQTEMAALAAKLQTMSQIASEAQALLTSVLLSTSFVPVPSFVAGIPATPDALAAAFPAAQAVQNYWVVLRGREPGLYLTVTAANAQTSGVPNQYMAKKNGRDEALAFYLANYPAHVKKWVPIPAPVPTAAPINVDTSAPGDVAAPAADTNDWVDTSAPDS